MKKLLAFALLGIAGIALAQTAITVTSVSKSTVISLSAGDRVTCEVNASSSKLIDYTVPSGKSVKGMLSISATQK